MQIGLLGKANVGKSTFFSAATQTPVATGNFPFTTIEPNIGVAHVKADCACKHFGIEHKNEFCISGTRFIPVKLIDIAGLVPGAHQGKGLGNQFLDDSRQADVLIHVVDISGSTDIQGQPIGIGEHDPLEDIAFVQDEFDHWFFNILKREWQNLIKEIEQKTAKLEDAIFKRFSGLGISINDISDALHELNLSTKKPKDWDEKEMKLFSKHLRINTKPMIIAANKADLCQDLTITKNIDDSNVILCSAESELLLRKAAQAGLIQYMPGNESFSVISGVSQTEPQKKALALVESVLSKIHSTGIQNALNSAVFDLLNLIIVFPVEDESKLCNKNGDILPDVKLLKSGSTAKDLAETIHKDIAKGFLYAIDVKTKQRIGADHTLNTGDVIKIVSSLSRG